MRNSKTGKNPYTGKEFLLFNIEHGRNLVYSGKSFQTRWGAEQNKTSKQIIVRSDLITKKMKTLRENANKVPDEKRLYGFEMLRSFQNYGK